MLVRAQGQPSSLASRQAGVLKASALGLGQAENRPRPAQTWCRLRSSPPPTHPVRPLSQHPPPIPQTMSHPLTRQLPHLSLARRALLPSPSPPLIHSRAASSSWSLPSLRNLLPSRKKEAADGTDPAAGAATVAGSAAEEGEAGKGLFDAAVEDEAVRESVLSRRPVRQATFVSSGGEGLTGGR